VTTSKIETEGVYGELFSQPLLVNVVLMTQNAMEDKSDRSTAGVTVATELFQDSYDVAAFIFGVRDEYLCGFPVVVHGDNEDGG